MTASSPPFEVWNLRTDVPGASSTNSEPMGSKEKVWLRIIGQARPWLFKFSRQSAGIIVGEHWSEKLGAEFAQLLGVRTARVELATLDGRPGSLVERFPELGQDKGAETSIADLIPGNDVLAGHDVTYPRASMRGEPQHCIERIIAAITLAIPNEAERQQALKALAGIMVLDALILNTDRHHENWGIIQSRDAGGNVRHSLAPSFDMASSLARNEPEARCAEWLADHTRDRAEWYARRGQTRGGIWLHDTDTHGTNPLDLVAARSAAEPSLFRPWLERVRGLSGGTITALVDRVPDSMIGLGQRAFVTTVVHRTRTFLCSLP